MRGKQDKAGVTVIIRREEAAEAGHHGGAWKVAYADFVTAMMAFFLLMWLINATTEEQRQGLADYFSPHNVLSHGSSGTGAPFGGHTPFDQGAMVSDRGSVEIARGSRPTNPADDEDGEPAQVQLLRQDAPEADAPLVTAGPATRTTAAPSPPSPAPAPETPPAKPAATQAELRAEQQRQERQALEQAAQQIRDAVRDDPALAGLERQLRIDMTPEGLRIQILDEDRQPMFATGSATPNERTRLLLQTIAPVLTRLPEGVSIAGYTDAAPFPGPGRTNWELSSERANATRRLLVDAGLPERRVRTVTGHADREPLVPDDPLAAANRRIAIVVLRAAAAGGAPVALPQGTVQPAAAQPPSPRPSPLGPSPLGLSSPGPS
jgi:chemotaxis protein MotB